jgi:hypothetical protein
MLVKICSHDATLKFSFFFFFVNIVYKHNDRSVYMFT